MEKLNEQKKIRITTTIVYFAGAKIKKSRPHELQTPKLNVQNEKSVSTEHYQKCTETKCMCEKKTSKTTNKQSFVRIHTHIYNENDK